MDKRKLLENFERDFNKARGSLNEVLDHNRVIDGMLVEDMSTGNFKNLEEHLEISKLILDATKGITSLYKEVPGILKAASELAAKEDQKKPLDLTALMRDDEDEEESKDNQE